VSEEVAFRGILKRLPHSGSRALGWKVQIGRARLTRPSRTKTSSSRSDRILVDEPAEDPTVFDSALALPRCLQRVPLPGQSPQLA
jgi:hypothetical protein